ncbi:hypothetical protein, partial [Legionella israelensis]
MNNKEIESWQKNKKIEDLVKYFNDIIRQSKEIADKKVPHLSKLLDTYRKDLELHREKTKNRWLERVKDVKYDKKTGSLFSKKMNCDAALRITEEIKNGILKNKNLSSVEKIKQFDDDLSPKNKTMTLMRFPLKLQDWRTQNEKTLYRRT